MSYISIRVRYLSPHIKTYTGVDEETVMIEKGASVGSLLRKITSHRHELYEQIFDEKENDLRPGILLIVNNEVVQDLSKELKEGDTVIITIAYDGG